MPTRTDLSVTPWVFNPKSGRPALAPLVPLAVPVPLRASGLPPVAEAFPPADPAAACPARVVAVPPAPEPGAPGWPGDVAAGEPATSPPRRLDALTSMACCTCPTDATDVTSIEATRIASHLWARATPTTSSQPVIELLPRAAATDASPRPRQTSTPVARLTPPPGGRAVPPRATSPPTGGRGRSHRPPPPGRCRR